MPSPDRVAIARRLYGAYESGDRSALDTHLSEDFTFYSPADVGIDLDRYFERCWPGSQMIEGYEFSRMIEIGNEMLVTYDATRSDGTRFRNTEILTFRGDQVCRAEVYFGWNLV